MSRLQTLKDVINKYWPELCIHPTIGRYAANKAGDIICIENLKTLRASKNCDGYLPYSLISEDGCKVNVRGHRFVFECIYPDVDISEMHIDHINQVRHDNRIVNLQALTPEEHYQKTMSQNPDMVAKALATLAKPVLKTELSGEVTRYHSMQAAATANGIDPKQLKRMISKYQHTGPQWDYEVRPKKNEHFTKISEDYVANEWWPEGIKNLHGLEVSTLGRVMLRGERLTSGVENNNGLAHSTYNGKQFLIHHAVLFAFYGPPSRPNMVGRHISGDHADNSWKNLRWEPRSIDTLHTTQAMSRLEAKENAKQQADAIHQTCQQLHDRICVHVKLDELDTESGAAVAMANVEVVYNELLQSWNESFKNLFIQHFAISNISNALIVVKKVMGRVFGISCRRKSKRTDCKGFHTMVLKRST